MRVPKVIYKTIISVFVLLVLTVGGGVGYTWYMGQNTTVDPIAMAEPVAAKPKVMTKAPQQNPNAPASASVQMITSPVEPGSNASITVKTNIAASCTIKVEYDEVASTDSGLSEKVADEYGVVSWAWTVEETVPYGEWPVKVTCAHNEKSAVVQGTLKVAKKE